MLGEIKNVKSKYMPECLLLMFFMKSSIKGIEKFRTGLNTGIS